MTLPRHLTIATIAVLVLAGASIGVTGQSPATDAQTDAPAWSNANAPASASSWGLDGSQRVLVTSIWEGGTFRSLDNGHHWEKIEAFPPVTKAVTVWDPSDPEVGYVAGSGGVARTLDAGESWIHVLDVPKAEGLHVNPDGSVLVGVWQEGGARTVLASTDRLTTVEDLDAPVPDFIAIYGVGFGPTTDDIVVSTVAKHYHTDDGGISWTEAEGGGEVVADDGVLYRVGAGAGGTPPGGVLRSNDGGASWEEIPAPAQPRELAVRADGGLWIATVDGLLISEDDGATWTNVGFADALFSTTHLVVDPSDPEAVFATTEDIGVAHISPDGAGGYTLETRTTGFPPVEVWSLGASNNGELLLAGGPVGLYASQDDGATWSHTTAGIGFPGVHATDASADASALYASGRNWFFHPRIEVSQDAGETWEVHLPQLGGSGTVLGLATHPTDEDRAFAAVWMELVPSHVLETTDKGETWHSILVMEPKIFDVAWDSGEGTVLAATELGVLAYEPLLGVWVPRSVSTDASRSVDAAAGVAVAGGTPATLWRTLEPGLPFLPGAVAPTTGFLDAVAVNPLNGTEAWAATDGGELHRCDIAFTRPSLCTPATPPGAGVRDVLVTPDGLRVLAASTEGGLWQASLD